MERKIKIEASLACANFKNLEKDIRQLEEAEIDFLHIDIMDGTFVPNFALDFSIMKIAAELCNLPMSCHLMIEKPERYIEHVAKAGGNFVSIHIEATYHMQRVLKQIRDCGMKAGVAMNPATPLTNLSYILNDLDFITIMTVNPGFSGQSLIPDTLKKIRDTKKMLQETNHENIEIEVDGNVSFANIPEMIYDGATMLVGGTSSIFSRNYTISEAVAEMKKLIEENSIPELTKNH